KGVLRLSEGDQAANTRREWRQRRDHAHDQLIHHAAEYPECAADHLPRLQSRVTVSISRTFRPPCLDVPVRRRPAGWVSIEPIPTSTREKNGQSQPSRKNRPRL